MDNNQCDGVSQQDSRWIFTEFTGGFTALIFPDCSQTTCTCAQTMYVPMHRSHVYLCVDHSCTCTLTTRVPVHKPCVFLHLRIADLCICPYSWAVSPLVHPHCSPEDAAVGDTVPSIPIRGSWCLPGTLAGGLVCDALPADGATPAPAPVCVPPPGRLL